MQTHPGRRGSHQPHPFAAIEANSRTAQQADAAKALIQCLSRVQAREGDQIARTWRQLAKALGKPVEGLSQREARLRYRGSIRMTLIYLQRWGYLEGYEALYEPNGEGRCILIALRAGVAQSVRAARSRPPARRRRGEIFFGAKSAPPPGGLQGACNSTSPEARNHKAVRAAARSTRERAFASTGVRAALAVLVAVNGAMTDGLDGAGILEARPELAAVPIDVLAREAWRCWGPRGDLRCSPAMQAELETAASQLERCGYAGMAGPGAAAAALIDLCLGEWQRDECRPAGWAGPPRTLGGLAACYRKVARRELCGWRARRRRLKAAADA